MKLELSDVERLMLANQFEILSKLSTGRSDEGYAALSRNLREGHWYLYEQNLGHLLYPALSHDNERLVLSALALYERMQDAWNSADDKRGVREDQVQWPGFDGNNEGELMDFASALYRNGQYKHVMKAEGKNSHMPTTERNRQMLDRWSKLRKSEYESLTIDEVAMIVRPFDEGV